MMNWLKHWSGRIAMALIVAIFVAGLASTFPADIAFLMAVDLGTWVEAAIAVYVVAQVTKVRPAIAFLRARLFFRKQRSSRGKYTRSVAIKRESSNDDDPASLLAIAV